MGERMTDKRLAEIEGRRLRTPTGKMPDGKSLPPLPADSDVSEQLLQALKAERAKVDELEAINKGLVKDFNNLLIDGSDQTLITELREMAEKWAGKRCRRELTALLDKRDE